MATHSSAIALAETPHATGTEDDSSKEKIEALTEIICAAGEEAAAALFVLMGTLQDSPDPKVVAHTLKHLAFTRCGEFNLYGMIDAQIAVVEDKLFAQSS